MEKQKNAIYRAKIAVFAFVWAITALFPQTAAHAEIGFFGFPNWFSNTPENSLPLAFEERLPRKTITVVATAYNSVPEQTDDTPFITANGAHVAPGTVAANFLPFGTYVMFPDVFGDRLFKVEDRMNARYGHGRVDIWMEDHGEALTFGAKAITMEVF